MAARFYRASRSSGSIEELKVKVWRALCTAEEVLKKAERSDDAIRAVHAVIQAGTAYGKILKDAELAERLASLEEAMNRGK